jgi:hypothetical protein
MLLGSRTVGLLMNDELGRNWKEEIVALKIFSFS